MREEGLDYHEIAAALGLAVGSVGTTLARARRRLVEAWEAVGGEARGTAAAAVAPLPAAARPRTGGTHA